MKYYDRFKQRVVEEVEYKKGAIQFLYTTAIGRIALKTFVAKPWFSRAVSQYHKSKLSRKDIAPFVDKYHVRLGNQTIQDFNTFNDFFIRPRHSVPESLDNDLVAVADAKLSYYQIEPDLRINIKQSTYSISELLNSQRLAEMFHGGTCLVYRLAVNDNHRYNYMDSGKLMLHKKIKGELHTIRPIAEKYHVFARNTREVSLLSTEHFGQMAQIEVGALLIGKINNYQKTQFCKNEEKGYFEFGGSTIIILIDKPIEMDDDIVAMNTQGIEIQVKAGERIGKLCSKD